MQFAVTVRADHVAFLHFLTQPFERDVPHHLRNIHVFGCRISMVKIQARRVILAASRTRNFQRQEKLALDGVPVLTPFPIAIGMLQSVSSRSLLSVLSIAREAEPCASVLLRSGVPR
jgi:hypothetical protein